MTLTYWQVFILSALPLTELRATIPLAMAMGLSPLKTYLFAVVGNLLPVVPLMFILQPLSEWLSKIPALDRFFHILLSRSRHKGGQIQKYGIVGLILFVSLPLPGTGAWTGALLAWLLGLDVLLSVMAISLGVITAGIIVSLASLGVIKAALIYDIEPVLLILAVVVALYFWFKSRGKKK